MDPIWTRHPSDGRENRGFAGGSPQPGGTSRSSCPAFYRSGTVKPDSAKTRVFQAFPREQSRHRRHRRPFGTAGFGPDLDQNRLAGGNNTGGVRGCWVSPLAPRTPAKDRGRGMVFGVAA